ncbi:interleukin-2 receptor subunit alpha-like isoform X2 [Hemicordylus capensis]|uniref:interleukin-2 receptor subunit alpha-like isoform X2 n=1 Tax=Hemicordylus capensis TaxID=884348 RepID=UPI0023029161|nr:interleukin-2 receptor subunit alpha-like isoform X2 [Hemicordylus capensis]
MSNLYLRFGLLLVWGIFQSIQTGEGGCPNPDPVEFAKIFVKEYVVGTVVNYKCEPGYKRRAGTVDQLRCINKTDKVQWSPELKDFLQCIVYPMKVGSPSEQPATKKLEGISHGPQATAQPVMKGFCDVPKTPEHATVTNTKYQVGQKVWYQCLDGYQAQPPISAILTCQNSRGNVFWSGLTLRCRNDSTVAEEATVQHMAAVESEVLHSFASAIFPATAAAVVITVMVVIG